MKRRERGVAFGHRIDVGWQILVAVPGEFVRLLMQPEVVPDAGIEVFDEDGLAGFLALTSQDDVSVPIGREVEIEDDTGRQPFLQNPVRQDGCEVRCGLGKKLRPRRLLGKDTGN